MLIYKEGEFSDKERGGGGGEVILKVLVFVAEAFPLLDLEL